jgi:hypothetical protein
MVGIYLPVSEILFMALRHCFNNLQKYLARCGTLVIHFAILGDVLE